MISKYYDKFYMHKSFFFIYMQIFKQYKFRLKWTIENSYLKCQALDIA